MGSGLGEDEDEAEPLNSRIRLLNCIWARGPGLVGRPPFGSAQGRLQAAPTGWAWPSPLEGEGISVCGLLSYGLTRFF